MQLCVKALICPGDGIKVIKVGAWRYPTSGAPAGVIRNSVCRQHMMGCISDKPRCEQPSETMSVVDAFCTGVPRQLVCKYCGLVRA